jgi:hypothetical protein
MGRRIAKDKGCVRCERIDRINRERETMCGRVVERMHFLDDWCLASDLRDALDLDETTSATMSLTLQHLMRHGTIESERVPRVGVMYRLAKRRAA